MDVKIFQTKNGKEPFIDWLEKIKDKFAQTRIRQRIRRIELGSLGDCRSLGKGFYEMKIDFGPGYRVYFTQKNQTITLLSGGIKKTQSKDIIKVKKQFYEKF